MKTPKRRPSLNLYKVLCALESSGGVSSIELRPYLPSMNSTHILTYLTRSVSLKFAVYSYSRPRVYSVTPGWRKLFDERENRPEHSRVSKVKAAKALPKVPYVIHPLQACWQ